jgi:hypothetical protein
MVAIFCVDSNAVERTGWQGSQVDIAIKLGPAICLEKGGFVKECG